MVGERVKVFYGRFCSRSRGLLRFQFEGNRELQKDFRERSDYCGQLYMLKYLLDSRMEAIWRRKSGGQEVSQEVVVMVQVRINVVEREFSDLVVIQ